MVKCNPATKQVEQMRNGSSQNDEDVETLLNKFEEIKENTNRRIKPHDVTEFLPESVEWDGNRLWQYDTVQNKAKKTSLTRQKKEILRALHEGLTYGEIEEKDIASSSYISRTNSDFGFIIESPALKEAFLDTGRVTSEWELVDPESGEVLRYESRQKVIRDFNNFCESFGTAPKVLRNGEEVSFDNNEESQEESDEESQESYEKYAAPLDDEDWKVVVAALNRDDKDDLANYIIDTFL